MGRILSAFVAAAFVLAPAFSAEASAPSHQNCVQYVQANSTIKLSGDAWKWWTRAHGRYSTGAAPRSGSVLVFKQTNKMRNGHLALVARVLDSRTIAVDHANWAPRNGVKGRVARGVLVEDTSARNDWSEVRVWNEAAGSFGYPYKTYGFIHDGASS